MLQARQATRTVGAKAAMAGLILSGVLLAGCQPGVLPCDKDQEWQAICKGNADALPAAGGGSGNGGSGQGGSSGGSGGNGGTALTKDTAITGCDKYKTLGAMDDFFAMRCGSNAACHDGAGASAWTNLKMPDVWSRLKNTPAKFSCRGDNIIDGTSWDKSVLWRKTRMPVMCAGANPAMSVMPPPAIEPKMPMLTTAEDDCLKGFLKAIAP